MLSPISAINRVDTCCVYALLDSHWELLLLLVTRVYTHKRSQASLKTWWEGIDVGFDQTLNKKSLSFLLSNGRERERKKSANRWPLVWCEVDVCALLDTHLPSHTRQQTCTTQIVVPLCVSCEGAAGLVLFHILITFFFFNQNGRQRWWWPPPFKVQFPSSVSTSIT